MPLLLYFPGKEPSHKEFLGWDPHRGIFRAFLHVYVLRELGSYILRDTPKPWQLKAPDPEPTINT